MRTKCDQRESAVAPVRHFDFVLHISLVEQIGVKLRHSLLIAIIVVFAGDNFFLQFKAENVSIEHGFELFGDDFLLGEYFGHGCYKEKCDLNQYHDEEAETLAVPAVGVKVGLAADVNHQQDGDRHDVSQHDEHVVADLIEPKQGDHIESVEDLDDYHYDPGNLRVIEQRDERSDNAAAGKQRDEYIIFGIPLLTGHLLQQDVIVRVVHLKPLPIAGHKKSYQHKGDFDQGQNGQDQSKDLQSGLSAESGHLEKAGEEQHVEDESDDASREDNLFPSDEDGSWTVRNAIHQNQHQPEHAQHHHHHDELRSVCIGKAVVLDNAQSSTLQRQSSPLEPVSPVHQRNQLNVLKDIAVDPVAHGQHEEVHAGDDCGECDEGTHLRGRLRA